MCVAGGLAPGNPRRGFALQCPGPAGLIGGKAPGNASRLGEDQPQALAAIVERGPIPAIHEVVRWRLADLVQWIWEEFGISLSETTVGRELQALGCWKISARLRHHAQNGLAIDAFHKDFRSSWTRSAKGFQPEPRESCGGTSELCHAIGPSDNGERPHRAEEPHHPTLGETRHAIPRPSPPMDQMGIHLRRDLPEEGKGPG